MKLPPADDDQEHHATPVGKPGLKKRVTRFHRHLETVDDHGLFNAQARISVRIYRFFVLLLGGLSRIEIPRRAAALTYTTILSIFPLLAVFSASASLFYTPEKEQEFMGWIEKQFLPSVEMDEEEEEPILLSEDDYYLHETRNEASQNLRSMISSISQKFRENAASVGVFGFIGLLVTCGLLYMSIESVVNMTWRTEHRARFSQTLTSFITVLVFAPIILAVSVTSSTVAIMLLSPEVAAQAEAAPTKEKAKEGARDDASGGKSAAAVTAGKKSEISGTLRRVRSVTRNFGFLLPYISVFMNAFILGLAYNFLPKTKVYLRYSFVGGLITAVLWQVARQLFVVYINFSSTNRTLVDALGVSVIFLLWIYITWLILLLGNLLVFTMQNYELLWAERRTGEQMLLDSRLLVAVMIVLARRFTHTGGGFSEMDIRTRLGLQQRHFDQIILRLVNNGFVTVLARDAGYQIAHPPEKIPVREILAAGCDISALPISRKAKSVALGSFDWLQDTGLKQAGDATLADLLIAVTATAEQVPSAAASRGHDPVKD
ncbi:YihY/virulence factor BrkB family protein [Candidatus Sumerlaeota bacterium]|nr:YihY/virulence factor BrkB family protein [Candidatus Sumerlaeota bacterium]